MVRTIKFLGIISKSERRNRNGKLSVFRMIMPGPIFRSLQMLPQGIHGKKKWSHFDLKI